MQSDPKSSQQHQRYEAARQQAEQQRVAAQKQAWLKQSLARRRIDAARQQQQLLLRSRAQAFQAKVDALRSALLVSPVSMQFAELLKISTANEPHFAPDDNAWSKPAWRKKTCPACTLLWRHKY